ncbi:ABC transporter [Cryptosporidium ryanae]|uniref:ABC transporter n=1 Tax=Cryptosporidium ryanae TaxID=515981 RepID=UPI00351A2F23|nr:ABC transporter [Cryptosporidium ryanae]
MLGSLLDDILLLRAGSAVDYLYKKNKEKVKNKQGNIRSTEIPDIFGNKDSLKDVKRLYKAFEEKDKLFSKQNNEKCGVNDKWNALQIFKIVFYVFRYYYIRYIALLIANVILSYYTKHKFKGFFDSFVNNQRVNLTLEDVFSGLLLLLFQTISIIFTTHCEYYGMWIHYKIQTAISGSSILRFLECKRLRNKEGICFINNVDSIELLSLYQNIVLVDSGFTEYAISNSLNILIYPLHIVTSTLVAHSVFGGLPLMLCLASLFVCFSISVSTQYLSSLYKRPFLKAREERITETIELLKHSRYLSVTHQLFPSISKLLNGKRLNELYFNSCRKYICMVSEIFDRWMILSCTLTIGIYIVYNKLSPTQASLMLIQSVWLIPTFYHPLNDIVLYVYYIVEGNMSMDRISNFLLSTKKENSANWCKNCSSDEYVFNSTESFFEKEDVFIENCEIPIENKYFKSIEIPVEINNACTVEKIRFNNISFTCGRNLERDLVNLNLDLVLGEPCFITGQVCTGKTALLQGICGYIYNTSTFTENGGYFSVKLTNGQTLNDILDISPYLDINYVMQSPWIPGGFSLANIITCGYDYNSDLWKEVIHQCDLEMEFDNWGIKTYNDACSRVFTDSQFSTGQRVRLSLSRAIYSLVYSFRYNNNGKSKILLVDCVLNSLDPFVCETVIKRLFSKKSGLLSSFFSIFVVELPILDSIHRASVCNSFPYKAVKMSDKTITQIECISIINTNSKNSRSEDSEINDCIDLENDNNIGIGNEETEDYNGNHSVPVESGKTTATQIDIVKNKYSYYYPSNYFYIFYAGSKKKIRIENCRNEIEREPGRSNFEAVLMISSLIIPPILCKLSESLLLLLFKGASNSELFDWNVNKVELNHELIKSSIFFENELRSKVWYYVMFGIPNYLGLNALFFWSLIYNTSLILSMFSICTVMFLEIRIGLRAARYFHNSLLIGHLGATCNSILKWLPTSFILNRLSGDQLNLDYCITRRVRFVIIALNSMIISIIPSVFASSNMPLTIAITALIGVFLYNFYISYFINGCRTLISCYVSEYSPFLELIQTIGKGKKCITNNKTKDFFFKTSLQNINSLLKPRFAQISVESWFKMRIKLLFTVPVTLLNILIPLISNQNTGSSSSTKSILALSIATTTGLIPLLSALVFYWTKLETELVSVERCRLYLSKAREAGIDYASTLKDLCDHKDNSEVSIKLTNVDAEHLRLDSFGSNKNVDNSYLVGSKVIRTTYLNGVTCTFRSGEVIGIVGRTGSGKTTLLDVLSNTLPHTGGSITTSGLGISSTSKTHNDGSCLLEKLRELNFPENEFDSIILKTIVLYQENLSHIAFLPLEVYCPSEGTVRDILDPFGEHSRDSIEYALNICGLGRYINGKSPLLLNKTSKVCERHSEFNEQEEPLIQSRSFKDDTYFGKSNKGFDLVHEFIESKLKDVKLGIPQLRMLLFASFYLKRDKIKILLLDEPPVFRDSDCSDNDSPCILSSIITKHFSHCITFIVSHDVRSLQYVNRVIVVSCGRIVCDSSFNKNITNSELLSLVKSNRGK